jgi:hypothetical protein
MNLVPLLEERENRSELGTSVGLELSLVQGIDNGVLAEELAQISDDLANDTVERRAIDGGQAQLECVEGVLD